MCVCGRRRRGGGDGFKHTCARSPAGCYCLNFNHNSSNFRMAFRIGSVKQNWKKETAAVAAVAVVVVVVLVVVVVVASRVANGYKTEHHVSTGHSGIAFARSQLNRFSKHVIDNLCKRLQGRCCWCCCCGVVLLLLVFHSAFSVSSSICGRARFYLKARIKSF